MIKAIVNFFMLRVVSGLNFTGIKYFFTGREYDLTTKDIARACEFMLRDRFIGLSWKKTHISSYLIAFAHWLITGRWSFWAHAWINVDNEEFDSSKIKIFEAVAAGTIISPFWKVLNCDAILLLKPKNISEYSWDRAAEYLKNKLGAKYDIWDDFHDDKELNCVELVVEAILHAAPESLPNLQKMMRKYNRLTPQMIAECGDFKVCLQIRR